MSKSIPNPADRTGMRPLAAVISLVLAVAAGFSGAYLERCLGEPKTPVASIQPINPPVERPQAASLPNFSEIVASNRASVVAISVRGMPVSDSGASNRPSARPASPPPSAFEANAQPPESGLGGANSGAGFVVAADGLIMTNAHLFTGGSDIRVTLADRREFKAQLVGMDTPTDTALLRIAADDLPTVRFGDAGGSRVGDWVVAIGAPYGFDHSVTAGIISAKSRALPNGGYVPFLQTDVALNPGNSGGPLFNTNGEVIGINSRIFSQSGGYEGISFAVPIDMALKVERDLLAHGKVDHARLGLEVQDLDQSLADAFGLKSPDGVLVTSVSPDSAALKAGMRPGDVILAVNGEKVSELADMGAVSADLRTDSSTDMSIWRQGRRVAITLKADGADRNARQLEELPLSRSRFGLVLRPSEQGMRRAANSGDGLIVDEVAGPAAAAGILPGDTVLAINGLQLTDPRQLLELESRVQRHAALLVQRGTARRFVPLELE